MSRGLATTAALIPYTPVLGIDGRVITGQPIMAQRPRGLGGSPGDKIEDIGNDLFGSPEPGTVAAAEPDPYTGAWLEIQLTSPVAPTVTLRSEIFDRIGAAARAAGPDPDAPIAPFAEAGGDSIPLGAVWEIGLALGEVRDVAGLGVSQPSPASAGGAADALDSVIRSFASLRRDMGGREAIPMVVVAGLALDGASDGELVPRFTLDALHVPATPPADAAEAAQDAQATVGAESLVVRLLGDESPDLDTAGSVFRTAHDQAIALVLLRPGDTIRITGASPDAVGRMSMRLAEGYSLLTPAVAPSVDGESRTAWWLIDPETGVVRDEHESGRHGTTEELVDNATALQQRDKFCRFAAAINKPLIAAMVALYMLTGSPEAGSALKQWAKIAQLIEENRKKGKKALDIACLGTGGQGPGQ
jgi:hypothetical protein